MMCEECHARPATVHFTKIVGGEKSEYHLCEQCARDKGDVFAKAAQAFDFNHLLSGLLNMESSPGIAAPPPANLRCDVCGLTYHQFTQMGRFGCPHCYESFASRLEPLLRRIQSNGQHRGKVPLRAGEQVKKRKVLDRLRIELQQAIAAERFERAAELRDQIRSLEQEFEQ
ncbi:UvrB/UvrC motif-containing protein [Alicyclobacillus cycloheptanicus]|nr:UvrB/UvrC motif-containing protein [Alicyclobacillus cycloheptanicus]WDM02917.1 UvrB/UvrC motif-containing protein [Alicyclobacillus cycloheptanicus]